MLEHLFHGSKRYWLWITFLLGVILVGFASYVYQFNNGLSVTGMGRDVSWGLYIGQFTFFVGVAASAVTVVLPYYLHDVKEFGKITIFGEFLAIASVIVCILFIIVDLGKPMRLFNMMIYATPNSMMFWDMIVLSGYFLLNLIIGWNVLEAEYNDVAYPKWVKNLIYLSIPWAVSIHTVTAFLIAGLPGRYSWLTAIMAARFLASAFASGPALLIIFCLVMKKVTKFDAGEKAIGKLAMIMTYAAVISVFFVGLEFFTVFYSQMPEHMAPFLYLFTGLEGHHFLVPFMWTFVILAVVALAILINPKTRHNQNTLLFGCVALFIAMMIDKGLGLIVSGFVPNAFDKVTEYIPTLPEILITFGVWAIGGLVLTLLYKMAISVKEIVE